MVFNELLSVPPINLSSSSLSGIFRYRMSIQTQRSTDDCLKRTVNSSKFEDEQNRSIGSEVLAESVISSMVWETSLNLVKRIPKVIHKSEYCSDW